jgi:glycosyltransferase involved in cell wall biosynthesis
VGCPVLVSAEVGIATLVAEAGAGKVINCEPRQLAGSVREMLSHDLLRAEMGARGREAVRARLSWDGVAEQAETLYCRVARAETTVLAT